MSTRSDIIVHRKDGKWARIYCHWDGYLAHNGRILFEHYTSQAQAETLVALGDMSILAPKYTKPKGHTFDKPVDGYCVFYGRDRREKNVAARIGDTLHEVWPEQDTWTEFTYVWDQGKWWVGDPDRGTQTLVDLGEALMGKAIITPKVKFPAAGLILGEHQPHNPAKPEDHAWTKYRSR